MGHLSSDRPDEYLTPEQLALQFQCSTKHIQNLARRGDIPPGVRLGRLRRWPAQQIEQFLAARRSRSEESGA